MQSNKFRYNELSQEANMYSISGSLFTIFSLIMISIQLFLYKWSYDYPQMGFMVITFISLIFAVYYFLLDYGYRKNRKGWNKTICFKRRFCIWEGRFWADPKRASRLAVKATIKYSKVKVDEYWNGKLHKTYYNYTAQRIGAPTNYVKYK